MNKTLDHLLSLLMMYEEHPTYAVNSLITDNMSLLMGRGLKVLCFAFKESHMPTYTRHHEVIGGSTQAALNHRRSHRPSRLNHQKRDEGIGICSDALVERELRAGTLVRAFDLKLPGYAHYMIRPSTHPREKTINAFSKWLLA